MVDAGCLMGVVEGGGYGACRGPVRITYCTLNLFDRTELGLDSLIQLCFFKVIIYSIIIPLLMVKNVFIRDVFPRDDSLTILSCITSPIQHMHLR